MRLQKLTKTNILLFIMLSVAAGCKKEDVVDTEKQKFDELHKQFHGKYKPILSQSNIPVDINLDGHPSINLLGEIPSLANTDLIILMIYNDFDDGLPKSYALFDHFWPEQYFQSTDNNPLPEVIQDYSSNILVHYVHQASPRRANILEAEKRIVILPDEEDQGTPYRWTMPEEIIINENNTIKIIAERAMYTSEGMKTVIITTTYERYATGT